MAQLAYLRNVATLALNEKKCTGCGVCLDVCPHEVLAMNGSRRITIIDLDACMECGACMRNCPAEALFVQTGVGCAAAVINSLLGLKGFCCTIE